MEGWSDVFQIWDGGQWPIKRLISTCRAQPLSENMLYHMPGSCGSTILLFLEPKEQAKDLGQPVYRLPKLYDGRKR